MVGDFLGQLISSISFVFSRMRSDLRLPRVFLCLELFILESFLFQDGESFCVCQFFFLMCFGEYFSCFMGIYLESYFTCFSYPTSCCVWVLVYFLDFLFPLSYYSSLVFPFIEWMVP